MNYDKRPRQYAAEITKMHDKQDRVAALAKVPEHLQGLVRAHVEDFFSRLRHEKRMIAAPEPKPQYRQQSAPSLSNAQRDAGRGHCADLKQMIEN